jgi:hypothetical protein
MRGLSLMVGGGIEGFSRELGPRIRVGPAWGALIVFKPTSVLGIELGYTGAYNAFDMARLSGVSTPGANVQRHGGQVALSVALSATRVQPYVLGGVGIDRYVVSGTSDAGYASTTSGSVPLGGGVRAYLPGGFTLDLRGTYSFIFGRSFAEGVAAAELLGVDTVSDTGLWRAALYLGYTF